MIGLRELDLHFFTEATDIFVIILFSVLIAAIIFFSQPRILMVFILIFIYLLPRAGFIIRRSSVHYYALPIGYVLMACIMTRGAFRLLLKKFKLGQENPIKGIFLTYAFVTILGISNGIMNRGNLATSLMEIVVYFVTFFVFFITLDMYQREDCIRIFMGGILICGFLVSLYGILLIRYGESLLIRYVTYNSSTYLALIGQFIIARRTISSYGDPNALGAQLLVFCGIFTSLLLLGKNRFLIKLFLLSALILTVVCIYFTSSRASLFGIFVLLVLFAATRIKKVFFYVPILMAGYILLLEPIRVYYVHRLFTTGISPVDLRIIYIKEFFELLRHHPFGIGFGTTLTGNYIPAPADNIWAGYNSFYLHLFSRLGIHGVVIFILMFFLIVKYIYKGSGYIRDTNVRYFVFGGTCGIIAQQLNFVTNNVYLVPGGMFNFWIMCGMLTAIVNFYKEKPLTGRGKIFDKVLHE